MKTRNIAAGVVCALLLALCCLCACSASALNVESRDDGVAISAKTQADTMSMASFAAEDGEIATIAYDVEEGSIDISISNAYTGRVVYSETLADKGADTIVLDAGDYAVVIDARNMIGSVDIETEST